MKLGMFFRDVRSLVTGSALGLLILTGPPALAMNVGLGDVVKFSTSSALYRVLGAKLVDLKHITLDLEDVNSGATQTVTVERSRTLDDVPGLVVMPQASGGLPPYM